MNNGAIIPHPYYNNRDNSKKINNQDNFFKIIKII